MNSICVYCGSSLGTQPIYTQAARALGQLLARQNIHMVYGGAQVGLMGVVADAVLAAGGRVTGVIPQALVDKEIAHRGLSELHVVGTMHERKTLMAELSDGFIALPGGLGTFEEICEVLTWAQIGLHTKPCGLLNVNRFYDPLLALFTGAVEEGFMRSEHRSMVLSEEDPERLLTRMQIYQPPTVGKWIESESPQ